MPRPPRRPSIQPRDRPKAGAKNRNPVVKGLASPVVTVSRISHRRTPSSVNVILTQRLHVSAPTTER
jgi:hypothetical protein